MNSDLLEFLQQWQRDTLFACIVVSEKNSSLKMKAKTKNARHALSQSFMNNSFGKKFHICAFRSHF